jgi:hypothetical protein
MHVVTHRLIGPDPAGERWLVTAAGTLPRVATADVHTADTEQLNSSEAVLVQTVQQHVPPLVLDRARRCEPRPPRAGEEELEDTPVIGVGRELD